MNLKKLLQITPFFILSYGLSAAIPTSGAYITDETDFYVGGNALNDSLEMVNKLLCYTKNIRAETYINLPTATPNYLAIILEDNCNAAGKDSSGDQAAMSATSSDGQSGSGGAGGAGGQQQQAQPEQKKINQSRVTGNVTQPTEVDANGDMPMTAKLWANLPGDKSCMDPQSCTGLPFDATVYIKHIQTGSPSPVSRFGDFVMNYSIYADASTAAGTMGMALGLAGGTMGGQAFPSQFSLNNASDVSSVSYQSAKPVSYASHEDMFTAQAFSLGNGYLKGEGNTLTYKETFFGNYNDISITFSDTGSRGVYSREGYSDSGSVTAYYAFEVDNTAKTYCDKFLSGHTLDWSAMFTETNGVADGAQPALVAATTSDIENAGMPVLEKCFSLDQANLKKDVWRYGVYNEDGTRLELTGGSFPIRAAHPTDATKDDLFGWADYWGIWVDYFSETDATNANAIWTRDDGINDGKTYKLERKYVESTKITNLYKSLDSIHKQKISIWVDLWEGSWGWKSQWNTLLGNTCTSENAQDASNLNCFSEYQGYWDKDKYAFVLTHGFKWDYNNYNSDPLKELTTPIEISGTDWVLTMKKDPQNTPSDFTDDDLFTLWTWSPESQDSFEINHAAISNPAIGNSTAGLKTEKWSQVDLASLEGKTFRCIKDCIKPLEMNALMKAAADAIGTSDTSDDPVYGTPYTTGSADSAFDPNTTETYINDNGTAGDASDDFLSSYPGIRVGQTTQYKVISGDLYLGTTAIANNKFDLHLDTQTSIETTKTSTGFDSWGIFSNAYSKLPGWDATHNNWATTSLSWGMRNGKMVEVGSVSETDLQCQNPIADHPRYNDSDDLEQRYCYGRTWEGAVTETYEFSIISWPSYKLIDRSNDAVVVFEQPKKLVFDTTQALTASQTAEMGLSADDTGKSFTLTFEGFGNMWGIPGEVYDTCTGQGLGQYYYGSWNECHRWASRFVIPTGAELTNLDTTDTNKYYVKPLNGDQYLGVIASSGSAFTGLDTTDLANPNVLVDYGPGGDSANKIGDLPASSTLINNGKPSVMHGTILFDPSGS